MQLMQPTRELGYRATEACQESECLINVIGNPFDLLDVDQYGGIHVAYLQMAID